jgi:ribose transport system substrate-binding protein
LVALIRVLKPEALYQAPHYPLNYASPSMNKLRLVLSAAILFFAAGYAHAADKIKVGIAMYTLSAPYFVAQVEAAKAAAEKAGCTVVTTDGQNDMQKQIADVEDMLSQGINVLILNPRDPKGLVPATKACTAAKVPVICMDSTLDATADYVTLVQSSNTQNGELVGDQLVKVMGDVPLKIALLSGQQGNIVGEDRREGVFRGIMEAQLRQFGKAGFTVVGQGWGKWSQEAGQAAMEDLITAHKEINVLLAENDSMALGALLAINEAGKTKDIKVFAAADGQKEALALIKEGKYEVTGRNDPVEVATKAVEIALKVVKGDLSFPKTTLTEPVAITKDNVDKFYNPKAVF